MMTGWALAASLLHVTDLFAVGIGLDIAGAYLLARGLLLTPHGLWVRFTWPERVRASSTRRRIAPWPSSGSQPSSSGS
jgi:hypothetical protein